MFTIKHIDDYGNETLFSAASVKVLRNRENEDPKDGIIVEGVVNQDFNSIHYGFRSPNEPRSDTGFEAVIFVMNESGATVATYRL